MSLHITACNLQQGSVDQISSLSTSEIKASSGNSSIPPAKFSEYNNTSLNMLSDENIVDILLHEGIGSCYIQDVSTSCPTCFCAHYFKSKTVSWSGKGWPISPSSHDGSGCISSTQWVGYTREMATLDWVHNAAAQARNAFADPTNPCQITPAIAVMSTPAPEYTHSPILEITPTPSPEPTSTPIPSIVLQPSTPEHENDSYASLSDGKLVDMLLHEGIGSCYIQDASISCPSCFCAHYFKSKTVSWSGKGWPVNPASQDSTGCISTIRCGGYTSDMATQDWIHNAAAQARNAFADPSDPCQIKHLEVSTPTPTPIPTPMPGQGCSIFALFIGNNGNDPFNMTMNGVSPASFEGCKNAFSTASIDPYYLNITKSVCNDMTNYLGGPVHYSLYMGWNGVRQSLTNQVTYSCDPVTPVPTPTSTPAPTPTPHSCNLPNTLNNYLIVNNVSFNNSQNSLQGQFQFQLTNTYNVNKVVQLNGPGLSMAGNQPSSGFGIAIAACASVTYQNVSFSIPSGNLGSNLTAADDTGKILMQIFVGPTHLATPAPSPQNDSSQAYCTATQTAGSYVYGIPHVLENLSTCSNDTSISTIACQQDSSRIYQLTWGFENTTLVKTFNCIGSKPNFL